MILKVFAHGKKEKIQKSEEREADGSVLGATASPISGKPVCVKPLCVPTA